MAAIVVGDLTGATVEGSGVFDVLMRAVKAHLEEEFLKSRIKGPEYATVYLGGLEQVMTIALQFLLAKQKADLEAQLITQQILHTIAQTALVNQQTANAVIEATVLTAQKCKLDVEYDILLLTKPKVENETELLAWKVVTEKAQTLAVGVDVDSVVGKQKALYAAQTKGFARDAEQKAAKIMIDSWSIRRTTDETTPADAVNKLDNSYIGTAVETLLTGLTL